MKQPDRAEVLGLPSLHLVRHPLLDHKMTRLRDAATPPLQFAQLLREIGMLLAFPATADLATCDEAVTTPMQPATGRKIAAKLAIIPVLRAGLGLADGLREVAPQAVVWHLGLRRDEKTLQPIPYYNPSMPDLTLPDARTYSCLVADPMLATGGSASAALALLKARGFQDVRLVVVIAAPVGVARIAADHPDVAVYCAAVDERLNEQGYILPGLGDAGDRQFGTLS